MSRILFVVSSERGHINPCIGPAAHLEEMGHSVGFFSMYNVSEQLKRANFKNAFSAKSEPQPPSTINRAKYLSEQLSDPEWYKFSLKAIYVDRVAKQVKALKQVVADFKPDVLAVDPTCYEGAIVADQMKLPWLTLTPSLTIVSPEFIKTDLVETVKWFHAERDELFRSFGMFKAKFRYNNVLSSKLNICFATDALLGNTTITDVKRVGPSLPNRDRGDECDFPWKKLSDKVPVVYVWLGTHTYYQPDVFRNLMAAVKGREVQLVCAASQLSDHLGLEIVPKNVLLVDFTPQLSVLPAMAAHITHGGAASVMESLAKGVPMLVSPIYDDQAHQSYFIDKCGVGQRQDLARLNPDQCWKAIEFVLSSPRIKEMMEKVHLSYRKADGAAQAARLIDKLASSK